MCCIFLMQALQRKVLRHSFADCRPFVCTKHTQFVGPTAWHMLVSKTCEPEEMSPTSDALHFHLMRVHYQAMSIVQYLSFLTLRIRASSDVTESNYQKFLDMISFTCL